MSHGGGIALRFIPLLLRSRRARPISSAPNIPSRPARKTAEVQIRGLAGWASKTGFVELLPWFFRRQTGTRPCARSTWSYIVQSLAPQAYASHRFRGERKTQTLLESRCPKARCLSGQPQGSGAVRPPETATGAPGITSPPRHHRKPGRLQSFHFANISLAANDKRVARNRKTGDGALVMTGSPRGMSAD